MPNQIDANGLQVKTTDEIVSSLEAGMISIYGADIDLNSNSPDGQNIGIFSQAVKDVLDVLMDVYNMFSVESSYGISLHRLVAINGLALKAGSETTTVVDITTDRALDLPGLDQSLVAPFQVRDSNNTWTLVSSYSFGAAGTQALVFQAADMGPIQPLPNTITVQATPTLGVTNVNNPTVAGSVIGLNEESDVQLRVRHGQSFQLAAVNPADSVEAALLAVPSITDALVVENSTGSPIGGQPAHSIWAIVVGGTPAEIAAAIYGKKAAGCDMYGSQTLAITRPNGQTATMKWDAGVQQRLYTQFGIVPTSPGLTFDEVLLAQQLAAAMIGYWKLSRQANLGDIVRAMYVIEPRAILVSAGVSTDGMSYTDTVSPTTAKYFFNLAVADIDII